MSNTSLGLGEDLQDYVVSVSVREKPLLKELRDVTAQRSDSVMQIAPEQGQFMALMVKLLGAKRILEIGTFTGYSSLAMAQALPEDGHILTLDINAETGALARSFWERGGVSHKIEQHLGPATGHLPQLMGGYDMMFIDADKTSYDFYYEQGLRLLKPGGLMMIDNVLWSGQVANPQATDPDTSALRALNAKIHGDERVELSLLPLADGLTLVRKL